MPSLLLVCIEVLAALRAAPRLRTGLSAALLLLAVVSIALNAREYQFVTKIHAFEKWGPVLAHRMGEHILADAGPGRVLTLDPMIVAEAGMPTYLELSSGQFGWRTAHLLPLERRQRLKLVCPFDLDRWLFVQPPASLLVDSYFESLNAPLTHWAEEHGYKRGKTFGMYTVWTGVERRGSRVEGQSKR